MSFHAIQTLFDALYAVLHMKRLDQTESPIFVILYVLYFQRPF